VTAAAYDAFLEFNNLRAQIQQAIDEAKNESSESLERAARNIAALFERARYPSAMERAIRDAYDTLARTLSVGEPLVAVRSSATAEDSAEASFAGQQETFLCVRGVESVLLYIKKCYGSLFSPRAMAYREEKGYAHLEMRLSVGVMQMVQSLVSGVCFTLDPVNGKRDVIVIECCWGLGEMVVQGKVQPDRFVVEKATGSVLERHIASKSMMMVRADLTDGVQGIPAAAADALTREVPVPVERVQIPCLTDQQLQELVRIAITIERHYTIPMDIEWAIDEDTLQLFVLQARPETVWSGRKAASRREVLVRGLGASPGRAHGKVRVLLNAHEISNFQAGEVLVTSMTTPDWVPAMRRAAAIVTDSGGMTAHAAIVSRELGLPCVVGTSKATEILRDGQIVTVDGTLGVVLRGIHAAEDEAERGAAPFGESLVAASVPITATRVYMNLGEPEKIQDLKRLPFDGIGLMRVEFILASWVGHHPMYIIENKEEDVLVEKLAEGISMVAQAAHPRPVIVRFSDFKTNEYRSLKGGERFEIVESNPMLGWRGVSRYVSAEYKAGFRLECRAMKQARDELGLKNIWAMLPFARTTWEVQRALALMQAEGLERGPDFKVLLMAEVPSVVLLAREFAQLCDGFSIGSNDLTQLLLGADRDSPKLATLGYFDERDPAVKTAMRILIEEAHRAHITVSICGQAPSVYPDLTEFLVRCGIDSVSVNPDAVVSTRKVIAGVEQKILLENARMALQHSNMSDRRR
jgi:pyruvate,water dikinase